jgi:hypothetical protein
VQPDGVFVGTFDAVGTGTVAGYSGVGVEFTGTLVLDAENRVTGIEEGILTVDGEKLPANASGERNSVEYSLTAERITPSP